MGGRLAVIVALLAYASMAVFVSFLVYLVGARAARLGVARASFGVGPRLFRVRVLGVPVEVRALPLSFFVVPWPPPEGTEGDSSVADAVARGERLAFASLPRLHQIVFALLPLLVAVAMALAIHRAALFPHLAHDVVDLFRGALSPRGVARERLEAAHALFRRQGPLALALRFAPVYAFGQLTALDNLRLISWRSDGDARPRSSGLWLVSTLAMALLALVWIGAAMLWLGLG